VYSTCLFCKANLGSNEVVEHFSVGTRLAFESAKGRLWVICRRCSRWNLTPLEERWEAVEECERLFATTRLRYSTEHIGLARVAGGLDLIRVGAPQRPEFAAWRYGQQFSERYRRGIVVGGGVTALMLAGALSPLLAGVTVGSGMLLYQGVSLLHGLERDWRPVSRLSGPDGETRLLRGRQVNDVKLVPVALPLGWKLVVKTRGKLFELEGEAAVRPVGEILAFWNRGGAREKTVQAAVKELERVEHPYEYFSTAAALLDQRRIAPAVEAERYDLVHLPHEARLAMEMAAHEEVERQAMEGELQLLEQAWREAEEIAAIADRLALPLRVEELLAKHRRP